MNEFFEFCVPLLMGFAIGVSWCGWIKDSRAERRKEQRLIIDIPFERQQGDALFKELRRVHSILEKHIFHNKPPDLTAKSNGKPV